MSSLRELLALVDDEAAMVEARCIAARVPSSVPVRGLMAATRALVTLVRTEIEPLLESATASMRASSVALAEGARSMVTVSSDADATIVSLRNSLRLERITRKRKDAASILMLCDLAAEFARSLARETERRALSSCLHLFWQHAAARYSVRHDQFGTDPRDLIAQIVETAYEAERSIVESRLSVPTTKPGSA